MRPASQKKPGIKCEIYQQISLWCQSLLQRSIAIAPQLHPPPTELLVAGLLLGYAAWWLTLSTVVGLVREKFTPAWMARVNQLAGTLIAAFGVVALIGTR